MITERILVLAAGQRSALGTVRDQPGLSAAPDEAGQLWLRGLPATGPLPLALRQLPALASYEADGEGRLFPAGRPTPTGRLPPLAWLPLAAFIPLEMPTAALPGHRPAPIAVRLIPSAAPRPGAALLTTLASLKGYVETAPAVRLAGLRFAVAAQQQALIVGTPLPSIPGQEYWVSAGLLLPAGFDFEVPLVAKLLASQRPGTAVEVLLFFPDGPYEVIPAAQLHPVSRSAVRLTTRTFLPDA